MLDLVKEDGKREAEKREQHAREQAFMDKAKHDSSSGTFKTEKQQAFASKMTDIVMFGDM